MTSTLLSIRDLSVAYPTHGGELFAVKSVQLDIQPGEIVGVVGESGAGKSTLAWSIMRLLRPPGRIRTGAVLFRGVDLLQLGDRELRRIRGSQLSLVPSNSRAHLDPLVRVGSQVDLVYRTHRGGSSRSARETTLRMLRSVGLTDAERVATSYPTS